MLQSGERVTDVQLEDYFDFVGSDEIRIKRHRIGIERVLAYYRDGFSAEQIAQEFPGLSLEKIHATLTYYWHNKAEVDAYIERIEAMSEAAYQEWVASPPPIVQRLKTWHARQKDKDKRSA